MELQLYQQYSLVEIIAAFSDSDLYTVLCDGEFIVFSQAIVAIMTLDRTTSASYFSSPSQFTWKPQRHDYAPQEIFPWFPEAIRETRSKDPQNTQKHHHLFARPPFDEHYIYLGIVHLSSYGTRGKELSATFSLKASLPRHIWTQLGGSLEPHRPFTSFPIAPPHQVSLRFHRTALDLLRIHPPQTPVLAEKLRQLEQEQQLHLPASVQEWYTLHGCMDIMQEISLMHSPVDITNYDPDVFDQYRAASPHGPMLPIMVENQGVWHLAVALTRSDDPPVYLAFQNQDTFTWHLHSEHFSDFVYAWVWDYVTYKRDYIMRTSPYMVEEDLELIRAQYKLQNTTFMKNGYFGYDRIERYIQGDKKITLMYSQESIEYWFSAETAESMQFLLQGPWSSTNKLYQIKDVDIEMQKMYLW